MISLIPIDQTVAGKQIHNRGMLIGAIRTAQRFLELPVSSEDELAKKNREELSLLLTSLETDGGRRIE